MPERLGERFAVSQKNGTVNPLGRVPGPAERQYDHCTPEWCDAQWPGGAPWSVFAARLLDAKDGVLSVDFVPVPRETSPEITAIAAYGTCCSVDTPTRLAVVARRVLDAHWHERLTDNVLREVVMDAYGQARGHNPGNWDFDRLRRVAATASKGAGGRG